MPNYTLTWVCYGLPHHAITLSFHWTTIPCQYMTSVNISMQCHHSTMPHRTMLYLRNTVDRCAFQCVAITQRYATFRNFAFTTQNIPTRCFNSPYHYGTMNCRALPLQFHAIRWSAMLCRYFTCQMIHDMYHMLIYWIWIKYIIVCMNTMKWWWEYSHHRMYYYSSSSSR